MKPLNIAILHYSAPPVAGGVEAVMLAQARLFSQAGYPVTMIAGRGEAGAMPEGVGFVSIPEIDSDSPLAAEMSRELEQGRVPPSFEAEVERLEGKLEPVLAGFDRVIAHNVFTKHFNLVLTSALARLLEKGKLPGPIAWCHDLTWTSPHSRSKVFPGYPWDLLRTPLPGLTYVTISKQRQMELANLWGTPPERIRVIYNGVDPRELLRLSDLGERLVRRMGLLESDLNLLMPVRVTQAKNIEYAMGVARGLKEGGLRARVVITGPPDPHDEGNLAYYRSLLMLREQLGVEDEVHFVYECGPGQEEGLLISAEVVAELYAASDLVFMPSHREGFGIPVLEAGLLGRPVWSASFPAAVEVGYPDEVVFDLNTPPEELAQGLMAWTSWNPTIRLRRRVRQEYTWEHLFRRQIEPLVQAAGTR